MTQYWVATNNGGASYYTVGANFRPKEAVCLVPQGWQPGDDKYIIVTEVMVNGSPVKQAQLNTVQKNADQQAAQAQEAAEAASKAVKAAIKSSINFGNKMIEDFAVENVLLGITQDGMTGQVLDNMASVSEALRSGSLYEAMDRVRAIPAENKDAKYITDARLLSAINKIEQFLGLEVSLTL